MIKEIPILFSTPMVQAILQGRKTMTRRIVKFPKDFTGKVFNNAPYGLKYSSSLYGDTVQRLAYALPGDILWVRETWSPKYVKGALSGFQYNYPHICPWTYLADDPKAKAYGVGESWKPSIHMPKDACRIWLEVTAVRAERLHDITEEDAISEGIEWYVDEFNYRHFKDYLADASGYGHPDHDYPTVSTAVTSFSTLWQKLNGKESLQLNPWVWVISFKVLSTTGRPE